MTLPILPAVQWVCRVRGGKSEVVNRDTVVRFLSALSPRL